MAISKETAKKLAFLWKDENKIQWIETFLKIVNKSGKEVPFILTEEQKYFVNNLSSENIVSKSRQLGLSSVTIALSIRQCVVYPNSCCLLVSHDQKSCNAVFDKLKQQFNSLPDWLKPKTVANNRAEIKMLNGSKITCSCAGLKQLSRGDTLNFVHLSEFAFWKNANKHLNSINQALGSGSTLIIESTSNGMNEFAELFTKAQNKESGYKDFFFNWINGRSLFEDKYKEAVKKYKAIHNKTLENNELDAEEKELSSLGASLDQLMWRRLKVATDGLDMFHQEYPSLFLESIVSTGANIFNNRRIAEVEKTILTNKIKPLLIENITDLPLLLKQYYGKSFFIWKIPKHGERYYIGVDASAGIGKDYTVIQVLDKNGEQVAEFYNNKLKPYQMAEIVNLIGKYYNYGLITVETASGGNSIIERLRYEYEYMNMTKYRTFDQKTNKSQWKIGFDTNNKTKGLVINDFVELFDKYNICINSLRLLSEMKTYVADDNGSMGASGTNHDDEVMAFAMSIVSLKNPYYYA